jgi:hypothetical protein
MRLTRAKLRAQIRSEVRQSLLESMATPEKMLTWFNEYLSEPQREEVIHRWESGDEDGAAQRLVQLAGSDKDLDSAVALDFLEDLLVSEPEDEVEPDDYEYGEDMDGDAESALASVGWGTDEDYGYYGDDDGW